MQADFQTALIAGGDTTAATIEYGLYYLVKYPELQNELYNELLTVFKDKNNINLHNNMGKLNVLRAFVREILRLTNVSTIGGIRQNIKPISIKMYDDILKKDVDIVIPKKSIILPNMVYASVYSKYWNDYNNNNKSKYGEINLDAWLETDKNGNKLYKVNPNFVTFGIGKRNCIGMSLALREIACFFAHMLLKYKFSSNNINNIKDQWGLVKLINPEIGYIVQKR